MKERKPANSDNRTDSGGSEIHPSSFLFHPSKRVEVVAAAILNERGQFLLAQRPAGKVYAGYWEFPGGKVEPGEAAAAALKRELHEELGIEVLTAYPWLTRDYDYTHAAVRLRFYRVPLWSGTMRGKERQNLSWQTIGEITVAPLLPANGPVLRALSVPPVYGITCAHELGRETQLVRLKVALQNGLRLVQVREKHLSSLDLRVFASEVVRLAHPYNARVLVNGASDIARQAGADGVHLTAAQLATATQRPACDWCGASCHDAAELERARELGVDFVALGPLKATASHPGKTELGWQRCAELIRNYTLPVFVLGGMRPEDLEHAWCCGAHGIAMMRGAWPGIASH